MWQNWKKHRDERRLVMKNEYISQRKKNWNLNGQFRGKYKTLDKYLKYPKSRYWGGHLFGLSRSWLTHADIFPFPQLLWLYYNLFLSFLQSDRTASKDFPRMEQPQLGITSITLYIIDVPTITVRWTVTMSLAQQY